MLAPRRRKLALLRLQRGLCALRCRRALRFQNDRDFCRVARFAEFGLRAFLLRLRPICRRFGVVEFGARFF